MARRLRRGWAPRFVPVRAPPQTATPFARGASPPTCACQGPPRPRFSVEHRGQRWWLAEHDPTEDLPLSVLAPTTRLLNLRKSAGEIPATRALRLVR
jgi:hypothetical protein